MVLKKMKRRNLISYFLLSVFVVTNIAFADPNSCYKEFVLQTSTGLHLTDSSYTFCVSNNRDLYLVKRGETGTKTCEVHVLSADSNYQTFSLHTGTAFPEADDSVTFLLAPNRDLFAIKKNKTKINSTLVYVLSADSQYKKFSVATRTALPETDNSVTFLLAPNRDLFAIKKNRTKTKSTQVYVLSADSQYKKFSLATRTVLPETDDSVTFLLAPNRDLFAIRKNGTKTKSTEVYVLSADSNYQTFSLHTGTALPETGENFAFCLATNLDIFAICMSETASHTTELNVLSGAKKQQLTTLEAAQISPEPWINQGSKQLTDGSVEGIVKTPSLSDLETSSSQTLKGKDKDNDPFHGNQRFELSNKVSQAPIIKTEEPQSVPDTSAYKSFLESMSREKIEEIATSVRQKSSAKKNCVHLAHAMIEYFSHMIIPTDVSEEDCDLDTYTVEINWDENPDVIKLEEGASPSQKKKRKLSKERVITQSKVVNAGPFEGIMPAQQKSHITLGDEGEVIHTQEIYDLGEYSQKSSLYSKVSDKLKEIANGNQPVKVSFGKVNLGRMNPETLLGHMIVYFATPVSVWYIDLQQIQEGIGRAVYDSLDEIFDFYTGRASKKRNTADSFSPMVFFVPLGPHFITHNHDVK